VGKLCHDVSFQAPPGLPACYRLLTSNQKATPVPAP
jgi:hypothetical protein